MEDIRFFTRLPKDIVDKISTTKVETGKKKEQISKEAFTKYFEVK